MKKNRITEKKWCLISEGKKGEKEERKWSWRIVCSIRVGWLVGWYVGRFSCASTQNGEGVLIVFAPLCGSGESPKTPRAPGVLIGQCVTGNCRYSCAAFSGLPAVALGTTCMDGAYSCTQGPWSTSCFSRCDASPHFRR